MLPRGAGAAFEACFAAGTLLAAPRRGCAAMAALFSTSLRCLEATAAACADAVAKLVAALALKDAPASGGAPALLHGETAATRGAWPRSGRVRDG